MKFGLAGICFGLVLSFIIYVLLERFYTKRFIYYYNRLLFAFTGIGMGFIGIMNLIQNDITRATGEGNSVFQVLIYYFMEILRTERDLGKTQPGTPEWIDLAQKQVLARERFKDVYDLFLLFGLVNREDGWAPYKRKAEAEFAKIYPEPAVAS